MEDFNLFDPPQKVSYLQARDPSILSWNRHGIEKFRHNLANEYESESTISVPSEKGDSHINVYLRIKDGHDYEDLYTVDGDKLICKLPEGSYSARSNRDNDIIKQYKFTQIFGPDTSQDELFNEIMKPKILNFINGHNSTFLAYGASGSGKTFTMVGTADQPGIIPRSLEYLFRTLPTLNLKPMVKPQPNGRLIALSENEQQIEVNNLHLILPYAHSEILPQIQTYKTMQQRLSNNSVAITEHSPSLLSVYVSFAEIYNENVYDLLQQPPQRGQQRPKLKIGGSQDQIYIKGLKYIYVRSGLEAYQVLQYGKNNLKYADTAVNMHSSRSHCIFTVRLVQGWDIKNSQVSTFNFCDLAGSERLKKTMNVGDRLKESNNINSSLFVLGRCISMIRDSQHSNKEHNLPPFRESKLTQIFQRALMGNEDIVMIININPSRDMFDESQHTLNFAGIAKEIVVKEQATLVLKPNRFTSCFTSEELLPYIREDESEELRELKNERAKLILEISELKEEHEEQLEAERQHLRDLFEQMISIKENMIDNLKKENRKLKEQQDVIVLSDDDDEENEVELNLRMENQKLQAEVYDMNQRLRMVTTENDSLKQELCEAHKTIEDAKDTFAAVLQENILLKQEIENLRRKTLPSNTVKYSEPLGSLDWLWTDNDPEFSKDV